MTDAITASLIKAGVEIKGAVIPDKESPLYFSQPEQEQEQTPQAAGTHTGLTVTLGGQSHNIPIVAVAFVAAVLFITHRAVSK